MRFNFKFNSFNNKNFPLLSMSMLLLATACGAPVFADSLGQTLQQSMIWSTESDAKAVAFRKTFNIDSIPDHALLNLFADSKYMLYLNGHYVARGPCRFDPKRPEFDSIDVASHLSQGRNTLAILVYAHVSGGDAMEHTPGLTVNMELPQHQVLKTDLTWKLSTHTRFQAPEVDWDGIREMVRADLEPSDWLAPSFNDHEWQNPIYQDPTSWGEFKPRTTPLLSETEVPFTVKGKSFPFTAQRGQTIYLELKKNIMGFCKLRFEAEAGSQFSIFGHRYYAREGEQEYVTADVFASGETQVYAKDWDDNPKSVSIAIQIDYGTFNFKEIHVVNAIAPLVAVGKFESSDRLLNRFFEVIKNMHSQITQDTYTDGAAEGNEWMADIFNISKFTKVAFAGPRPDGSLNYADRRHLAKAILDIGISQSADGRVKAHHPSDRFDKHAYIEDFQALWVMSIRNYYEMTHDESIVQETYETMKKQMSWFQSKITDHHLFSGREWMIFDNPYAYENGEGATLNAIIYKAFLDASFLASLMGDFHLGLTYLQTANEMKAGFNEFLWNSKVGTPNGMPDGDPTTHAAIMALYTHILDDDKVSSVQNWLLNRTQKKIIYPLAHLFWFQDLYDMNSNEADQQVLDIIRSKYGNKWNAYNRGFITSEGCHSGRNFHNFGMVPGYFMSTYILGVQTEGPAWNQQVLIEPRLGDLTFARGTVVTENGPVQVSWEKNESGIKFNFTTPESVNAKIGIPYTDHLNTVIFDGKIIVENGIAKSNWVQIKPRFVYVNQLSPGTHSGSLKNDKIIPQDE